MIWNVYGVRGLRDTVKAKVREWNANARKANADMDAEDQKLARSSIGPTGKDRLSEIPDDVAEFICAEVDRLPPECLIVKVDAYGQTHERADVDHVTRTSQVTVVGIKG